MYKKVFLLVIAVLLLGLMGACSFGKTQPQVNNNGTETEQEQTEAVGQSTDVLNTSGTPRQAIIETAKGKIAIQFYPQEAPNTVANFAELANKGFYDGVTFHRVEPGFVVQGGDPEGTGRGGPGYAIKAEINNHKHLRGAVAMARRMNDMDSAGSQFYICLSDLPSLDGQYTIFGQVIEGMDVVDKIAIGDKMNKVTIINE